MAAWNKGLTYEVDSRIPRPWLGKKRSKETIEKIRVANSIDKIPFTCHLCNRTILLKPYQTKGKKYCSRDCTFKAMQRRVTQYCRHCGKEYAVIQCLTRISKYCSRLCQNKALAKIKSERTKVPLVCGGCGKTFTVNNSEVDARQPKYCSPQCFQKRVLSGTFKLKISNGVKQYYKTHPESKVKLREYRLKQIIPSKDTAIEVALQRELNRRGIPYQKHLSILNICQPDIVFLNKKVAVFADGDYWHRKNVEVIAKDKFQTRILLANGWQVLRFWEHEIHDDVVKCVDIIEALIKRAVVERVNP